MQLVNVCSICGLYIITSVCLPLSLTLSLSECVCVICFASFIACKHLSLLSGIYREIVLGTKANDMFVHVVKRVKLSHTVHSVVNQYFTRYFGFNSCVYGIQNYANNINGNANE